MKKYTVLLVLFFTFTFSSKANPNNSLLKDTIPIVNYNDIAITGKVFDTVETEASFRGDTEAWVSFLQTNLKPGVPVKKKAPAGLYTVMVQFIVDKEGRLSDIKALTNHGFGMEKEVIRVLKKSPRWEPAIMKGEKVKAYRKQPISFSIKEI